MRVWILGVMMMAAGCGDEGAAEPVTDTTSSADVDTQAPSDTSPAEDSSGPNDTSSPDTADTSAPPQCSHSCEPFVPSQGGDVTFTQFPTGVVPVLTGGALRESEWQLTRVDLHPNGTFADGFSVSIDNAGATTGEVRIVNNTWDLGLRLNLLVTVSAFGESGSGSSDQPVQLGGCFTLGGTTLSGDFTGCAEGFVSEAAIPERVDYEINSEHTELSLGLSLTRDGLLGLLPESEREGASYAIQGGMYLRARFVLR